MKLALLQILGAPHDLAVDVATLRAYREAELLGRPQGRYRRRPELCASLSRDPA